MFIIKYIKLKVFVFNLNCFSGNFLYLKMNTFPNGKNCILFLKEIPNAEKDFTVLKFRLRITKVWGFCLRS